MRRANQFKLAIIITGCMFATASMAATFEGRINAVMARGNQTDVLLYTAGSNFLRVENTATNRPNPVDILDRNSGELTLLFPNNRSFVRLKPAAENSSTLMPPGFPQMPGGIPPGVGPQSPPPGLPAMPNLPAPQGIGPANMPGVPAPPAVPQMSSGVGIPGGMPAMPIMPPSMRERMELHDLGQKTNILGFTCNKFEIKQRGETMEIWATDQLFPFQPYVQNQPHRFAPRMIQEQWPELVKARKLFPLLATLKLDTGAEQFRFEVTSVTPDKLVAGDEQLFQPPASYFEIQPLPF
jgi:hypothetical protein